MHYLEEFSTPVFLSLWDLEDPTLDKYEANCAQRFWGVVVVIFVKGDVSWVPMGSTFGGTHHFQPKSSQLRPLSNHSPLESETVV